MSTYTKVPASQFGSIEFAELNKEYFAEYIQYRLHGYHPQVAFRRTFGDEQLQRDGHLKVEEIEHNPYVRQKLAALLKAVNIAELWDEKIAVHELINLARNVFAKDNTRLGAIKELNILCGITVTDEKGNTKRGMSLDEFYKTHGISADKAEAGRPDNANFGSEGAPPTTH
jgi:hypothetical protein